MLSYKTLDIIADTYTPVLAIACVVFATIYFLRGDKLAWVKGFLGVVSCFVLMSIDAELNLWPSMGLDYSTHSALALALVVFLLHKRKLQSVAAFAIAASLFSYYALEVYQRYHSVADIVTTGFVAGGLLFAVYRVVGIIGDQLRPRLNGAVQ